MKRREFIGLVGGAMIRPIAARAQQPEQMRRIGLLMGLDAGDTGAQFETAALKRGLQERGWVEGRNIEIKYGWSGSAPDAIQSSAKEFIASKCEVIVARSTPAVAALLQETRTIPIVFTVVVDPVGSGFVQSFARPGGNVTGFQNYEFTMAGKWAQTLKEIAPSLRRIEFIYNPMTTPPGFLRSLEAITPTSSVKLIQAPVHNSAEIDAAATTAQEEPGTGLVVLPDIFMAEHRAQIIERAAKHGLPAIYPTSLYTKNDGLLSYGPDTPDLFYRAADYVDRILKGEKPADLPVQAPTKYQLVVNLKTAKALGIDVPATLLARADEVIE
jgi:putative tryptophan/tyrosine transport system substrate-binding protein